MDKCKKLDDLLDEKERDVGHKAEKIHILEALLQKKNLKFWTKSVSRCELNFGEKDQIASCIMHLLL